MLPAGGRSAERAGLGPHDGGGCSAGFAPSACASPWSCLLWVEVGCRHAVGPQRQTTLSPLPLTSPGRHQGRFGDGSQQGDDHPAIRCVSGTNCPRPVQHPRGHSPCPRVMRRVQPPSSFPVLCSMPLCAAHGAVEGWGLAAVLAHRPVPRGGRCGALLAEAGGAPAGARAHRGAWHRLSMTQDLLAESRGQNG